MGFQLNMPLGFRREMAGVRNAELQVTKERAKLQEGELELSHQLAFAIRDLEANYVLSETNFNRRIAAQHEVEAVSRAYENDTVTIDRVLEAQRSLAAAESEYYRSSGRLQPVDYPGPPPQRLAAWSTTACIWRKARGRPRPALTPAAAPGPATAALHLDYGFTKPEEISRGPMNQEMDSGGTAPAVQPAAPPAAPPASRCRRPPTCPFPLARYLRHRSPRHPRLRRRPRRRRLPRPGSRNRRTRPPLHAGHRCRATAGGAGRQNG